MPVLAPIPTSRSTRHIARLESWSELPWHSPPGPFAGNPASACHRGANRAEADDDSTRPGQKAACRLARTRLHADEGNRHSRSRRGRPDLPADAVGAAGPTLQPPSSLSREPGASIPGGRSGRCSRWECARDNPGAPARPPRTGLPGSPR